MTENSLRLTNLTIGYDGHPAVHHLDGTVARGELLAVVGANGSGKSTLLKGVAGMISPLEGTVERNCRRLAYLPQQIEVDRDFPATVADLIALGLWQERGLLGRIRATDRGAMHDALRIVGLEGFEKRSLDTLSGGQFQRALFARAILQDADLILLDEPFNAVDSRTVADLIDVAKGWARDGRTVICVLHDLGLVRTHFERTLLMARGAVAWGRTIEVLVPANLLKATNFEEAWNKGADWCDIGSARSSTKAKGMADA